MATAAEITAAFAASLIPVEPALVERLTLQLSNTANDLDRLIGELGSAECWLSKDDNGYLIALAYKSALREQADPTLLIQRLRRNADAKRASAEDHRREEAEFAGKATHRHNHGEHALARRFEIMAEADGNCATRLEDEALALEIAAGQLEAAIERQAAVITTLNDIVGRAA